MTVRFCQDLNEHPTHERCVLMAYNLISRISCDTVSGQEKTSSAEHAAPRPTKYLDGAVAVSIKKRFPSGELRAPSVELLF